MDAAGWQLVDARSPYKVIRLAGAIRVSRPDIRLLEHVEGHRTKAGMNQKEFSAYTDEMGSVRSSRTGLLYTCEDPAREHRTSQTVITAASLVLCSRRGSSTNMWLRLAAH